MDAATLRSRLHYDPETGIFTWKTGRCAGSIAGSINKKGYRIIHVRDRVRFYAHHLAWLYVHGVWPDADELDHENRCRDDNRIENLRPATRSQNKANSRRHIDGQSGFKGATRVGCRWRAQIFHGHRIHLGYFDSAAEAHAAYVSAARDLFGDFANDGKERRS